MFRAFAIAAPLILSSSHFVSAGSVESAGLTGTSGYPRQIGLAYGQTPSSMVVNWAVFGASVRDEGVVEFGSSEDHLTETVVATSISYTLGTYTSPQLFSATMPQLKVGNALYYYRVGYKKTTGSGPFSPVENDFVYSEVRSFKTHPGVGKEDVTFHVIGDLGQTENSKTTLAELKANEEALKTLSGGIFLVGDLSYANGDEPLWDSYGDMREFVSSYIPFYHAIGNHEWFDDAKAQFTAYLSRFFNPSINDPTSKSGGSRELYYSFDAGLVHWVVVAGYCSEMTSTHTQPCLADGTEQHTWLVKDLSSVDRSVTPWVFVAFHEPYVNSNTAHDIASEGYPMQQAIEDILYDAQVDLVFSGHVHAYERSCRVYQYKCTSNAPYYITIGDGGNKEGLASGWVEPQPEWSMFRQASYGFGSVRVFNETHALWQWRQNSDLTPVVDDEFYIVKQNGNGGGGLRGVALDQQEQDRVAGSGVTKQPVFADNARGEKAAEFNLKAILAQQRMRDGDSKADESM